MKQGRSNLRKSNFKEVSLRSSLLLPQRETIKTVLSRFLFIFVQILTSSSMSGANLTVRPISTPGYMRAQALLEEVLRPDYEFQIMECIDLGVVEKAIREKDYENEMAQRFVAYRALCRPINYRVIAPVEDLLNQDMEFRSELEGSIRTYFRIFINTSTHSRSFAKYESRIKNIGIKIPDSIQQKIKVYLQWTDTTGGAAPTGD